MHFEYRMYWQFIVSGKKMAFLKNKLMSPLGYFILDRDRVPQSTVNLHLFLIYFTNDPVRDVFGG